jgi:hypothetical protein
MLQPCPIACDFDGVPRISAKKRLAHAIFCCPSGSSVGAITPDAAGGELAYMVAYASLKRELGTRAAGLFLAISLFSQQAKVTYI